MCMCVVYVLLFFDDAESLSEPSSLRDDLVLHELETHGHNDHANEQVECAQSGHSPLIRFEIFARHEIAKSDCCERDEAKICT